MNIDTGELRRILSDAEMEKLFKEWGSSAREVPDELADEAEKVLDGKRQAFVNLQAKTPLVSFAEKERKKNRRKMAKDSRKRNR